MKGGYDEGCILTFRYCNLQAHLTPSVRPSVSMIDMHKKQARTRSSSCPMPLFTSFTSSDTRRIQEQPPPVWYHNTPQNIPK